MWHRARTFFGYALLALGVAGVLLPIVPGTPFIFAAFAVLGSEHHIVRRIKQYLRRWVKKTNPEAKEAGHEVPGLSYRPDNGGSSGR